MYYNIRNHNQNEITLISNKLLKAYYLKIQHLFLVICCNSYVSFIPYCCFPNEVTSTTLTAATAVKLDLKNDMPAKSIISLVKLTSPVP